MKKQPRKSSEPILSKKNWIALIVYSGCMTLGVLGVELYASFTLQLENKVINNLTFYTLILAQLWHVFNLPEKNSSFFRNQVTQNKFVWYALALCLAITGIFYFIPHTRAVLSLVELKPSLLVLVLIGSLVPVVIIQFLKRLVKVIN